jgi:hypothetical protein
MTLSRATPERLGLLGGRYKLLAARAAPAERLVYLNKGIDAYEHGTERPFFGPARVHGLAAGAGGFAEYRRIICHLGRLQ